MGNLKMLPEKHTNNFTISTYDQSGSAGLHAARCNDFWVSAALILYLRWCLLRYRSRWPRRGLQPGDHPALRAPCFYRLPQSQRCWSAFKRVETKSCDSRYSNTVSNVLWLNISFILLDIGTSGYKFSLSLTLPCYKLILMQLRQWWPPQCHRSLPAWRAGYGCHMCPGSSGASPWKAKRDKE